MASKMHHGLLILMLFLSGCTSTSKGDIANPSLFASKDFKYGRYCGAGYPAKPDYSIPAYDDIDEVCKLHDKCYDDVGMNNAQCDSELRHRTKFLAGQFANMGNKYANNSSPEGVEQRSHTTICLQLVTDINAAFGSLMTTENSQSIGATIGKTIGTSLAIPQIILLRTLTAFNKGSRVILNQSDRPCLIE